MNNFSIAVQDSVDEVRKGVSVRDREVWFSFINPLSNSCLLVDSVRVKFFRKCVLVSLLPSLTLASAGVIYALKNGVSNEIELLVSLPILLSYITIIFSYIITERKSERLRLNYKPFVKVANNLSIRMKSSELLKTLAVMGGFVFALSIGALIIFEKEFYLIAFIILTVVGLSLSPMLLVITALCLGNK